MSKRFTKADKSAINKIAEIIRNTRYPNGYISPQVAAEELYRRGYKKQDDKGADSTVKFKN